MLKKWAMVALAVWGSVSYANELDKKHLSAKEWQALWKQPTQNAKALVSQMDVEAQIGQVLMLDIRNWGVDAAQNPINVHELPTPLAEMITRYKIGSLVLFRENLIDTKQTRQLIQDIQKSRYQVPIMLGVDQEGGYVTRLREGTEMPGNMALAATRQPKLAQKTGQVHGSELAALGFHVNFAPVVDVNINQQNPVIGVRSYGDHVDLVNEMSGAYIKGLQTKNIMATLKHFPGHGNVTTDTHVGLPTVPYSAEEWSRVDLVPFKKGIKNSVDMIMTAHIVFPALDATQVVSKKDQSLIGLPATLSKKILTDRLRHDLKFKGLVLTDALDMGAITENFGTNEAVKMALLAGVDIAVMPMHVWDEKGVTNLDALYAYLKEEMQKDPELARRIQESAARVVATKLKNKMPVENIMPLVESQAIVASPDHKNFEKMVANQAITLIKNEGVLPYALKKDNRVLVISDENSRNALINKELALIDEERAGVQIITNSTAFNLMQGELPRDLEAQIQQNDVTILVTYNLTSSTNQAQKVIDLANKNQMPLIVIASRNPYDIAYLKDVKANLAIYGITGFDITNNNRNSLEANIKAGLRTLFRDEQSAQGFNRPTGKLPVEIKSEDGLSVLYPFGHGLSY